MVLLRLDDASVSFGTLGERLGAVACSSEKKKTRAFMVGAHWHSNCTGAAKKKVIKFATSALSIGLFKTLHALKEDVSDGYQWNVKIISPEQRHSDNQ